ncbi:fibrobacter succinogenes major paralogous domain-containing protein [Salibacter sp.]|uniref:fibrobacter succinogenes major paralogous domain-containing protein n=1 Tax=Salibacter sp. TaxID=2010995 RepID=UPI0028704B7B|nr:fibrobacter succinogenes major paralogous domain-containing protein [Salibacter sp.]MDR9487745.1 fibrobacter succinogenes major paralogous domain-containing protein [Salibacter sp.]
MKKVSLILTLLIGFSSISYAQTVTIGTQVWMTNNLNVHKFRNGDPIPQAKTKDEWEKAGENGEPAWCYYHNDPVNGEKYGKLYNWYAVNDSRGLAPEGWKIPSDEDWTTLTDYLGGEEIAGEKMKSTRGWEQEGNGTNESGFSGLPGGVRADSGTFNVPLSGTFLTIDYYGYWWSSSEGDTSSAWSRYLGYDNSGVVRYDGDKELGLSVRCLRD